MAVVAAAAAAGAAAAASQTPQPPSGNSSATVGPAAASSLQQQAATAAAGRAPQALGGAAGKALAHLQQQQSQLQQQQQMLLAQKPQQQLPSLPPQQQQQASFLRQMSWTTTARSSTRPIADIKLASHVTVVHEYGEDFSSLVRRISIDRLEEEGKKINKEAFRPSVQPFTAGETRRDMLVEKILKLLLRPLVTQQEIFTTFNTDAPFVLPWTDVSLLCDIVLDIVKEDDMVLHLRAPIKVYGDIHGQYHDLMRLFHLYKMPVEEEQSEEFAAAGGGTAVLAPSSSNSSLTAASPAVVGDIDTNDYLFLGDYVDRGLNSLETICLLFALKVKYPRQVHLLRGNHEDPAINSLYGFQDECKRRLREDPFDMNSCWQRFNRVFEYLPVAAVIDDRVLCLHGGIGGTISSVADLATLQRPLKVAQIPQNVYEQRVTDLLWSDPTDNDSILGVVRNDVRDPDGSGHIYKFGPDRVHAFLAENNLQLIIRAHECVMDGFERFAGGKLITLFSATNYCNHHQNAGALLFIRRDMTIIPKLIYPANSPLQYNSWDARMAELRPPTPPRAAPRIQEKEFIVEERS